MRDTLEDARAAASTRSRTSPGRGRSAATTSSTGATSRSSASARRPAPTSAAGAGATGPSLADWAEALERGEIPGSEVVELDAAGAAREALVFGLRLVEGVDLRALGERFGVDIAALHGREIDELTADGLLIRSGGRLRIPADKLLVSNAILSRSSNKWGRFYF